MLRPPLQKAYFLEAKEHQILTGDSWDNCMRNAKSKGFLPFPETIYFAFKTYNKKRQ